MAAARGIKLDERTRARLKALAAVRDRSPHWLVKTAIVEYLDREEAYERGKREDMARRERYQLTGEAVPHDQASARLTGVAEGKPASCGR